MSGGTVREASAGTWVRSLGDVTGASLFAARAASSLLAFGVSLYLARVLGSVEFGRYAFVVGFLTFSSVFFDLGYFASGARLLAHAEGPELRRQVNTMVAIGAAFSALFIALAAAAALVVDRIFAVKIGALLLATAFLSPAFILPYVFEQLLKATGRIRMLSFWVVGTKVVSVAVLVLLARRGRIDALDACTAYMSGTVVVSVLVTLLLRPGLDGVRDGVRAVIREQQQFGRPLYVGKVVHLGSYHSDKLLLAAVHRAPDVGWYALAMAMAGGISMFGQSVAATAFRSFGRRRHITGELLHRNTAGIVIGSIVTIVVGALVLTLYLGAEYRPVMWLLVPASIATAFQGAYQPYNSWLLANGFGTRIRNFLFVVAAVNVVGNAGLIPAFGVYGAAAASIASMVTYWWLSRRSYRSAVTEGTVA